MNDAFHALRRHQGVAEAELPDEGMLPAFAGATGWINSDPLTPQGLRGHVVVVQFWTYTCINWLRTEPYFRAWSQRYRDQGLVAIGVHTPEFQFEHDLDNVRWAVRERAIDYPVVVDNDFAVWSAFANHYWPALYFIDTDGRIRHHRFGEGDYERSEMVLRRLLADAGAGAISEGLSVIDPRGDEVQADWADLESAETYLGYDQESGFTGPEDIFGDSLHLYEAPSKLRLNTWALIGRWTVTSDRSALQSPEGRVAFQFHARDVNLVMGPASKGRPVRFRVLIDGQVAGAAHGADVADDGTGTVVQQRMYQLIRQHEPIEDRRFEIEFIDAGAEAFCFTFG